MTTFNYVVLVFVLVLFGSVVPASAQEAQGYAGIIQTVAVAGGASFGVVITLLTFWWRFDKKLDKLGDRIDANTKKTNGKIETTRTELKEDSRIAHEAIGTNIRAVDADVKASEKRVTDNFNARFDDLKDYIKLAMPKRDE